MEKKYQVIGCHDRHGLVRWLSKHGQGLLPLVELVESTELALEELIDVERTRGHRSGVGAIGDAGGG